MERFICSNEDCDCEIARQIGERFVCKKCGEEGSLSGSVQYEDELTSEDEVKILSANFVEKYLEPNEFEG